MVSIASESLKLKLSDLLVKIEDVIASHGIHLPQVTLIARDPEKPGMIVVISSEGDKLDAIFEQAKGAK